MSDRLERVRTLCATLLGYAEDLDRLRAEHPVGTRVGEVGDRLWDGTVGAAAKVNGTSFWFDEIESTYAELDETIRYASGDLCREVLADGRILNLAPVIHRLRAAYERDKELVQARSLVANADAAARLKRIIEKERYWAMGAELGDALAGARHVLVAGSGPLPLTALSIGTHLDVRVTCVERDAECHALGRRLIDLSARGHRITCRKADVVETVDFEAYDVIVGVVLLGVDFEGRHPSAKTRIVRHIIEHMSPGTRLVLRDPHGLGRLLYPSVSLENSDDISVVRHVPEVGPNRPYRSALVVAERRSPDHGHAN